MWFTADVFSGIGAAKVPEGPKAAMIRVFSGLFDKDVQDGIRKAAAQLPFAADLSDIPNIPFAVTDRDNLLLVVSNTDPDGRPQKGFITFMPSGDLVFLSALVLLAREAVQAGKEPTPEEAIAAYLRNLVGHGNSLASNHLPAVLNGIAEDLLDYHEDPEPLPEPAVYEAGGEEGRTIAFLELSQIIGSTSADPNYHSLYGQKDRVIACVRTIIGR